MIPHAACKHCGGAPMLQTSGERAKAQWARIQCGNYDVCGMQTPQINARANFTLVEAKAAAWLRWDRAA